jgi:ABC-2 type transport system ATP-binding protein
MIEVTNLTKKYDDLVAVDHLNLNIQNELFVFLGPNGAGKTTTIRMMTGLLRPTEGSVILRGHDVQKQPIAAKQKFGLIPDTPNLYEKLTAREFVSFVGNLYEVDGHDIEKRMNRLFELFELTDRADDLIQSFSHGMKQKCALTTALIHDPDILFLDEPTVGLDPKSARNLKDLLRGLVKKGKTVFMSTHILEIAESMCDRVGIINKSKLIAHGTMDELRKLSDQEDKSLEDIFLKLTGGNEFNEVLKYLED